MRDIEMIVQGDYRILLLRRECRCYPAAYNPFWCDGRRRAGVPVGNL